MVKITNKLTEVKKINIRQWNQETADRYVRVTNFTPGKVLAPLMLAESEEIGIGSNQRPPHSVPATPTSVMFKTIKTYQKEQKWIKINEKHEKSIENY